MRKSVRGALTVLALLFSHQAFAIEPDGQIKGEYKQAYGFSDSLYVYTYTPNPIELHQTSCDFVHDADYCNSFTSVTEEGPSISLLFSSKFNPNEGYIEGQDNFDSDKIVDGHPNQTMIPIPTLPLTLIGDGYIQDDGSFMVNYGSYGLTWNDDSAPSELHADENGNINKWNATWGHHRVVNSTDKLDTLHIDMVVMQIEGSSTNVSSWVGTPVTKFQLRYLVFVPSEVSPVPEPESYAMLLGGLGLMGFVARRRQLNQAQKS